MFTFKKDMDLRDFHEFVGFDFGASKVWMNLTDDEIDYLDELMDNDDYSESEVNDFMEYYAEEELVSAYINGILRMPYNIIDEEFPKVDSMNEIAGNWVYNYLARQEIVDHSGMFGNLENRYDELMKHLNKELDLYNQFSMQHFDECFLVKNIVEYLNEVNYRVLWNADKEDLLICSGKMKTINI